MESIKNFFKYSFDFQGVCSRAEFWKPVMLVIVLQVGVWCLAILGTAWQVVALIVSLFLLVPSLSIMVRRLHDTDRGAINMLWLLVPLIGMVILLIFACEKTKYFPKV